ncbi:outer membrane beta-barrel protein [Pontibacter ruber]|uniref:Outer membrane beta-barrel protein n=1 Tax=Pontibacter ruber TaxID=1343895 RepID=A0ABW5CWU4_9BACT|nr:outer membrane beta-barrel protein [Pontibacter ruber]
MNRSSYLFILFFLISSLAAFRAEAQKRFLGIDPRSKVPERGIVIQLTTGLAAVKSDICGSIPCNDIGLNIGVGAMYKFTPMVAASIELQRLKLGAEEKTPTKDLAFRSEVLELSTTFVVNLLDSYSGSNLYRSSRKRFIVPYAKAGIGAVYYKPTSYPASQGSLDDSQTTYDPERNYPAVAAVIPFGGGMRFRLNDQFSVAPEILYHITTTDYLDNIGPRLGNASNKDHYLTATVKLLYTPSIKSSIFSKKK